MIMPGVAESRKYFHTTICVFKLSVIIARKVLPINVYECVNDEMFSLIFPTLLLRSKFIYSGFNCAALTIVVAALRVCRYDM